MMKYHQDLAEAVYISLMEAKDSKERLVCLQMPPVELGQSIAVGLIKALGKFGYKIVANESTP
jgi:hypothetical protein